MVDRVIQCRTYIYIYPLDTKQLDTGLYINRKTNRRTVHIQLCRCCGFGKFQGKQSYVGKQIQLSNSTLSVFELERCKFKFLNLHLSSQMTSYLI